MLLLLYKPPTLLLWSLILMMGSFFLKSQTTAFPLGLAEARMCCTCLFQDTTLMSSAGWNRDKGHYCQKLTWIHKAPLYSNNNTITPVPCKQCFVHIQMTLQRKLLMVMIVISMFSQSQIVFVNFLWMVFLENDHFIKKKKNPLDKIIITTHTWNGKHKFPVAFLHTWNHKHKETRKMHFGDCGFYCAFYFNSTVVWNSLNLWSTIKHPPVSLHLVSLDC